MTSWSQISPAEEARMRELRSQGNSIYKIAKITGRGHSAISARCEGIIDGSVCGDSGRYDPKAEPFPRVFADTIRRGKQQGHEFMDAWTRALDACENAPGWKSRSNRVGWQRVLSITMRAWQAAYEDQAPTPAEAAAAALAELAESEWSGMTPIAFVENAVATRLPPSPDPDAARKRFS